VNLEVWGISLESACYPFRSPPWLAETLVAAETGLDCLGTVDLRHTAAYKNSGQQSQTVKTLSSYHRHRPFQTSFWLGSSTRRITRAGVAQGGLVSPVLFSLYVNDMPTPSRHVQLALSHSHVPQSTASGQASWGLPQQIRPPATGSEDYYRLKGHGSALCQDHDMRPKTQATPAFQKANTLGQNSTVPWGNPWHMADLVGAQQGSEKGDSKIG
jgi:hypothetical protein